MPRLTALMSDLLVNGISKDSSFNLLLKSIDHNAETVQNRCLEIIARNFQTLLPTIKPLLNDLPLRVFSALLNHPSLSVTSEYRVYKIVRSYYLHHVDENGVTRLDKAERKSLFSAVRLAHLKYAELEKAVKDNFVPKSLLAEALTHRLAMFEKPTTSVIDENLPLRLRKRVVGRLFEPLSPQKWNELGVEPSSSGEAKGEALGRGVIYHLATNGGKAEWKNPSLTGSVKVSCSSMEKGKIHNFVDLEPQDCWSSDVPASWFAVDLRHGKLILSHYTLRHGGNSKMDMLRNWVLQACDNDGDRWIELARHTNDSSLQGAFATHTWKISSDIQKPFRQFRILQTGHNSGNSNFLAISGIELYGLFFPKSQS